MFFWGGYWSVHMHGSAQPGAPHVCPSTAMLPLPLKLRICTPKTSTTHTHAGNNELDQIQKIHTVIGTPPPELLARLRARSSHGASFDFPPCAGSGLAKMLGHVHPHCADLISRLLAYNPDERLSARQALRHPYFREAREADKRTRAAMQPDLAGGALLQAAAPCVHACVSGRGVPSRTQQRVRRGRAVGVRDGIGERMRNQLPF